MPSSLRGRSLFLRWILMLFAVDVKPKHLMQVMGRWFEMTEHKLRHDVECALTRGNDLLRRWLTFASSSKGNPSFDLLPVGVDRGIPTFQSIYEIAIRDGNVFAWTLLVVYVARHFCVMSLLYIYNRNIFIYVNLSDICWHTKEPKILLLGVGIQSPMSN